MADDAAAAEGENKVNVTLSFLCHFASSEFHLWLFQAPPPCLDLTDFPIKADFFEGKCCFLNEKSKQSISSILFSHPGMHLLPEEVEKVEGAANFRQVDKILTEDNFAKKEWADL